MAQATSLLCTNAHREGAGARWPDRAPARPCSRPAGRRRGAAGSGAGADSGRRAPARPTGHCGQRVKGVGAWPGAGDSGQSGAAWCGAVSGRALGRGWASTRDNWHGRTRPEARERSQGTRRAPGRGRRAVTASARTEGNGATTAARSSVEQTGARRRREALRARQQGEEGGRSHRWREGVGEACRHR